jgi:structure-specific recognition protein 1
MSRLSPQKELRIGSSGISWKALEGGKTINVPASELKWAEWTRVARQFQLRVGLKDTWRREAFDGFTRPVSKPSHTS